MAQVGKRLGASGKTTASISSYVNHPAVNIQYGKSIQEQARASGCQDDREARQL